MEDELSDRSSRVSPGDVFEDFRIFIIPQDAFLELRERGACTVEDGNGITGNDLPGLVLVVDQEVWYGSNDFLNTFVRASCIVDVSSSGPTWLVRTKDTTLEALLVRLRQEPSAGNWWFPAPGHSGPYGEVYGGRAGARAEWSATRRFMGHVETCTCGIEHCGSTYAWIEGDRVLLIVEISGGNIHTVRFGPLRLV